MSTILIVRDTVAKEDFTVVDENGDGVTGLLDASFTKRLYNPAGTEVSGTITVTVAELTGGDYRASFTPDTNGEWYLVISHPTFLTPPVAGTVQVFDQTFDGLPAAVFAVTISGNTTVGTFGAGIRDALGLMQDNTFIDEVLDNGKIVTSARIRIFPDNTFTATDGAVLGTEGAVAAWRVTTIPKSVPDDDKMKTYEVKRLL